MSGRDAVLVLESGRVFRGKGFGAVGECFGEVVFNTSMTGYQEIITDPSYAGQIVAMTATQIGNTGVNAEDHESAAPVCAGFVVREVSPLVSSWRAEGDLDAYLVRHGVVGIEGVDTRALTRALREVGAQRGAISTEVGDVEALVGRVLASPSMQGQNLVPRVTCAAPYEWGEPGWIAPDLRDPPDPDDATRAEPAPTALRVVAYDFGIKHNILRDLCDAGCRVTVVPSTTPAAEALALAPDGLFLSNGPGDPAAAGEEIEIVRELLAARKPTPTFGICLGHQILALAAGASTFKLRFGHHGGNHPVMDLATRKVAITSQNHGFAVDARSLPEGVTCTHLNLYDETVEGVAFADRPVFGIQYHPEASPGPNDATYLFRLFVDAMREAR